MNQTPDSPQLAGAAESGSDAPTCSACLDTPESDAMYNYCVQNSGPMSVIRMLLKMRELERERDLARRGILCAINGIGLMGEISYDCRGERDYHAKKVIGLLESYLISPQNDQAMASPPLTPQDTDHE